MAKEVFVIDVESRESTSPYYNKDVSVKYTGNILELEELQEDKTFCSFESYNLFEEFEGEIHDHEWSWISPEEDSTPILTYNPEKIVGEGTCIGYSRTYTWVENSDEFFEKFRFAVAI